MEISDELIARYLTGEATPEEAMALDDWLKTPANQLYFEKLQRTWNATFPSKKPQEIDVTKAWARVETQQLKTGLETKRSETKFLTMPKFAFGIAAAILIILTFGIALYFIGQFKQPSEIAISTKDTVRRIKFSDSSTAVLNLKSRILFPKIFEKDLREIQLAEGEAFFKITPNVEKPFIVHTGVAHIKVIGTAFNVVLSQNSLEVSVDEGKVLVYTPTDSIYLDAGFTASIRSGNTSFNIRASNVNTWAYASNKFVFKNTPLSEVFNFVEKARHCSIQMKTKEIGNCKLTATFDSASTEYILTLITEALNLTVVKNDNTFTVEGDGCE